MVRFLLANIGGVVANIMSIQTGVNLLPNLRGQFALGLKRCDKSMMIVC